MKARSSHDCLKAADKDGDSDKQKESKFVAAYVSTSHSIQYEVQLHFNSMN